MRYIGKVYRPPSEADAYLLQATIGCSWNKCTYCDMYRDKPKFSLRSLENALQEWRIDDGCSITALKEEVRALGINLATGKHYGSSRKLEAAIRNGAGTVNKDKAKRYPLVKKCLATVH